jgi:hypothetical protein
MTKTEAIVQAHHDHPDWHAGQIMQAVGCCRALLSSVKKTHGLKWQRASRDDRRISYGANIRAHKVTKAATGTLDMHCLRLAVSFPPDLFALVKQEAIWQDKSIAGVIREYVKDGLMRSRQLAA